MFRSSPSGSQCFDTSVETDNTISEKRNIIGVGSISLLCDGFFIHLFTQNSTFFLKGVLVLYNIYNIYIYVYIYIYNIYILYVYVLLVDIFMFCFTGFDFSVNYIVVVSGCLSLYGDILIIA